MTPQEHACKARDWILITIPFISADEYFAQKRWCHTAIGTKGWDVFDVRRWYFEDANKAMLFKLTWGGR